MASTERIIRAAARNNAEWCALMSRAHGVAGRLEDEAWVAAARAPVYFPEAVTLAPGADPAGLAARIDTALPGASIKDSFADLDLAEEGFEVLFEAQWIHRTAGTPLLGPGPVWEVIADADRLRDWALAWDNGDGHADLFRPELLLDPATFILAGYHEDGELLGGAVASCSDELVGISNVFARHGGPEVSWPLVLDAVTSLFPTKPVVGYEHGEDLATAVRHGFETLGPLRVWVHRAHG